MGRVERVGERGGRECFILRGGGEIVCVCVWK